MTEPRTDALPLERQAELWTYRHFPDAEYGEWYGYLHRDGRISVPLKGNLWKSFFHLPRMQWYCWRLLEEMGAASRRSSDAGA